MDLSAFDTLVSAQEAGIGIAIDTPDGDPTDIVIRCAGPDSERARTAQRRFLDRKLAKRKLKATAAELEREGVRMLAACVISWEGIQLDGTTLECTQANAAMLFERFPWIKEQVEEAVADRAAFFAPAATRSAKPSAAT